MSTVVDIDAAVAASREYVKAQDYFRRADRWYREAIAAAICGMALSLWDLLVGSDSPALQWTSACLVLACWGCSRHGDRLADKGRAAAERGRLLHQQAISDFVKAQA